MAKYVYKHERNRIRHGPVRLNRSGLDIDNRETMVHSDTAMHVDIAITTVLTARIVQGGFVHACTS